MGMHGGVARDGWHAIGLGYKKLLRDGTPGTAVVKDFYEMDEASTIGNAQHEFTLEVTVVGQAPYELQGLFRIPAKLVGSVGPGDVVPVKVHPKEPKKVAIDWKSWTPSERAETTEDRQRAVEVQQQTVHNAMPEETRNMMLNGWITAVQSGALSKADFDQALTDGVTSGMVTQTEADDARRKAG
jgi:hypothetical protein